MAEGDRSKKAADAKEFQAPAMDRIVEPNPADTLLNCALIVRFMARRLDDAGDWDIPFDADDGDAVCRILSTVGDALVFEYERAKEAKGGAA